MTEDFDQNANRDRHAVWEQAHEIGSPTHRLRTALVLSTVAAIEKRRREEASTAFARMSAGTANPTEFIYHRSLGTCLDAGCGTGEFSIALAGRGWRVTGFDPSEYAIGLARARAESLGLEIDFSVAGLGEFAGDSAFNLVLSVDVLEHIEDDAAAMLKLASLLSASGALVITVPMDPSLWSASDQFSGHHRRYTRESMAELAEGAGLSVTQTACYGYPFTRLMWRAKRRVPQTEKQVVSAAKSASPVKKAVARGVSGAAVGITSLDRLFTGAKSGVGLVAVCRKPRRP